MNSKYFAFMMFFKIINFTFFHFNNNYPYIAYNPKHYIPNQIHDYIKIQKRINPVKDILCY